MTKLAAHTARSRSLLGLAVGAAAFCSLAFHVSHALARSDRSSISMPPTLGQVPEDKSIAGGRGIGPIKVTTSATPTAAALSDASLRVVYNELADAFEGFNTGPDKFDIGITADGAPRIVFVSIGGKSEQTFWRYAPPDQPEGWFDDSGRRLGGSILGEPKPQSRISSQFGIRRYYGRISSGGFHNGIDYEGRLGEAIFAAADGVINHSGWYFEYGRTVKISHADRFETLYAHLSHFANGIGPGVKVRRGDLIGYVGMTGRSTGPHLHFSTIVNGQFVDPAPMMSASGERRLRPDTLVLFRQWQDEVRAAADADRIERGHRRFHNLQTGDEWTTRI